MMRALTILAAPMLARRSRTRRATICRSRTRRRATGASCRRREVGGSHRDRARARRQHLRDPSLLRELLREPAEAPILKYDANGKLLAQWGSKMFIFPHGATVDRDGNLWVTDARGESGIGHQVFKFNPDGKILMTLGKAGVSGSTPDLFDQPTDVVIAPSGDIFVTDSHRNGKNNRVVKFTKDGKYIKEWGKKGSGRGELSEPHTIAMDSRGRLFVGDRENNRIQIFDQDGRVPRRVAAVRAPERDLHHEGRHDLRRRFGVGP